MKVLILALIVALCSGCAAITPAMILSGAMGLVEFNQNQTMERRLARIEAHLQDADVRETPSFANSSSDLFRSLRSPMRVRVLTP